MANLSQAEQKYQDTWYSHRVSYGETDAMGYVYHAEFIHIFERSRGELCRKIEFPYTKTESLGFYMPVKELACKFKIPVHYDELIQVHVMVEEIRKASIRFCYEIYDEFKEKLLAEGFTLHACTNKEGRPVAIPKEIAVAFDLPN